MAGGTIDIGATGASAVMEAVMEAATVVDILMAATVCTVEGDTAILGTPTMTVASIMAFMEAAIMAMAVTVMDGARNEKNLHSLLVSHRDATKDRFSWCDDKSALGRAGTLPLFS